MPMDIISGYHKTIYSQGTESALMQRIGFGLGNPVNTNEHPGIFFRAWKTFPFLVWDMARFKKGEIDYDKIYERFNKMLLKKGVPQELIYKFADDFADNVKTDLDETDYNLIYTLRDQKLRGSKIGIFSTGYSRVIDYVFNYAPGVPGLDFLEANDFVVNEKGMITKFEVKYSGDRSGFPEIAEKHGFEPERTAYIADDPEKDGPCFEAFALPVLSGYADEEAREAFSSKYPHGLSLKEEGYDELQRRLNE